MTIRPRSAPGLAAAVLLFWLLGAAWASPPAHAHGGNFIPPPPPLGPPSAPRIPLQRPTTPPPSPFGPTTPSPQPVAPTPTTPRPATPLPPSIGPGLPRARIGRTRGRTASHARSQAWQTWWALNRLEYLPDRLTAFERQTLTPRGNDDPRYWTRQRVEAAQKEIVPFLKGLLRPEARMRDDVLASALIALGKVGKDDEVPGLLLAHLADARAAPIVRESAALALGLLRRSEAELRLPAARLSQIRERLIEGFDDAELPTKARAFCALSLGLLADQPYGNAAYAKDGRLVARALWMRLGQTFSHRDLPIALFTALGMQPRAGVPDGVRDALRQLVVGKRIHRRRWDAVERGHALTALVRLGGAGTHAFLLRILQRPREHTDVRRAAYLALGIAADRMDAEERADVARALTVAFKSSRDPLTRGLSHLAAGHVLGADLRHGETGVLLAGRLPRELLSHARNGPSPSRGFSALGLALAIRDVPVAERCVARFRDEAREIFAEALDRRQGDDDLLGAYAVAAGLAGVERTRGAMLRIVEDRKASPQFRGHAAVALGQLGRPTPEIVRALKRVLAERRDRELRRQSALALALVGGRAAVQELLKELESGETERLLAQVVIALGRLGDLEAVAPLRAYASDAKRSELAQALAVVALGLIGDPEPRPSLLRLSRSGFYPARTEALHEAYSIL